MQTQSKLNLSPITPPVWKRTPLPEALFITDLSPQNYTAEHSGDVHIVAFTGLSPEMAYEVSAQKGLGESFNSYVNGYYNVGYTIEAHTSPSPSKVKINAHHSATCVENNVIIAEQGSTLEVIFDYTSDHATTHHGITRVLAKSGSTVKVIKVQRLHRESHFFHQTFTHVEAGAQLEVIDIQLGSDFKATAHESHLLGYRSQSQIKSLYYGENDNKLDLSFTMRHRGAHSESEILSKGALDHGAKKVFRGNLMFDTGARQSVGREKEFVVLLNEKVHSDSIPALLCSEDDVIGEHAASVGQIDREKMFYLMSRGLSEAEAKKLIVIAAFEEIIASIGDAVLRSEIAVALERRLS